jgi:F-type H+-transporting ATPase subunit epsilon
MRLQVSIPVRIVVDQNATKVSVETANGARTLLPNHIDFVTALVPGLLSYEDEGGHEHFLAVDHGILVKRGDRVSVSSPRAIGERDLGQLEDLVEDEYRALDERQRKVRSALARLESDLIQELVETERR